MYSTGSEDRLSSVSNIQHTKECMGCGQVLPLESFPISRTSKTKVIRRPRCVECYNEHRRQLRNSNPKRIEYHRMANKRYRRENIEKDMISRTKRRALKKGFDFNLEESDIDVPDTCPLLGIKLEVGRAEDGNVDNSPSIDRIDPTKGYVKGNVWVISNRANTIKNSATVAEMIMIGERLKKLFTVGVSYDER